MATGFLIAAAGLSLVAAALVPGYFFYYFATRTVLAKAGHPPLETKYYVQGYLGMTLSTIVAGGLVAILFDAIMR